MARGNTAQSVSSVEVPLRASATSADAKPRPLADDGGSLGGTTAAAQKRAGYKAKGAYHKKLKTGERYGRGCWQGSRIYITVRRGYIVAATLATLHHEPARGWLAGQGEV